MLRQAQAGIFLSVRHPELDEGGARPYILERSEESVTNLMSEKDQALRFAQGCMLRQAQHDSPDLSGLNIHSTNLRREGQLGFSIITW
jgi:hypothetical protein